MAFLNFAKTDALYSSQASSKEITITCGEGSFPKEQPHFVISAIVLSIPAAKPTAGTIAAKPTAE